MCVIVDYNHREWNLLFSPELMGCLPIVVVGFTASVCVWGCVCACAWVCMHLCLCVYLAVDSNVLSGCSCWTRSDKFLINDFFSQGHWLPSLIQWQYIPHIIDVICFAVFPVTKSCHLPVVVECETRTWACWPRFLAQLNCSSGSQSASVCGGLTYRSSMLGRKICLL